MTTKGRLKDRAWTAGPTGTERETIKLLQLANVGFVRFRKYKSGINFKNHPLGTEITGDHSQREDLGRIRRRAAREGPSPRFAPDVSLAVRQNLF